MGDKAKAIILGTGEATKRFIIKNSENGFIDILGVIPDNSVSEEDNRLFLDELRNELGHDIAEYSFSEENIQKAEVAFSVEMRRFIPENYCNQFLILNCHGGLLPKWRGFSANAWAIMNGEKNIGFTIHRVRPGMDDGEIYYQKVIPIAESQTYGDVHGIMLEAIASDTPKVLYEAARGINKGKAQPKEGFVFCTKFNKKMGDISSFDKDAQYYVNLHRCMSKPLGTGIRFNYKGDIYEVGKAESGRNYGILDYLGLTGKVVNIVDGKLYVKTRDNVIVLSDITKNGAVIRVEECFRNGNQLGI